MPPGKKKIRKIGGYEQTHSDGVFGCGGVHRSGEWQISNSLLREVQLLRAGDGQSNVEPLHHQWIKARGNQLDIIEAEIADPNGSLAILLPGKTIVTIGLKQL